MKAFYQSKAKNWEKPLNECKLQNLTHSVSKMKTKFSPSVTRSYLKIYKIVWKMQKRQKLLGTGMPTQLEMDQSIRMMRCRREWKKLKKLSSNIPSHMSKHRLSGLRKCRLREIWMNNSWKTEKDKLSGRRSPSISIWSYSERRMKDTRKWWSNKKNSKISKRNMNKSSRLKEMKQTPKS